MYLLSKIKVKEIMTKDPVTVLPDHTIEETAEILLTNKISGVPVLDRKGKIVGAITQSDIFKALVSLTGLSRRGISFGFLLKDEAGTIKEVADIVRIHGGRMASILSTYERAPEGYRKVYIRMYQVDRTKMGEIIKEFKKNGLLYMVDHREDKREIYLS
jgi:acetoin utilization protein AcuB